MDQLQSVLQQKEQKYEDMCIRCGACCGAYDGDPCSHLRRDSRNQYYCDDYENRLGMQRTINGTRFKCVMIKEILHEYWIGDHLCVYKKKALL